MGYATGEAKEPQLRPVFDRRIKLDFHGARITSDGDLLAYRELDDTVGLIDMATAALSDGRRGKNDRRSGRQCENHRESRQMETVSRSFLEPRWACTRRHDDSATFQRRSKSS